ncbi:MAG: glutamate--tRNA ligase, partial [Planctomycetes bacterium]|nr:glutamate--tRNA ligase [Planctomycetota bacterium]
HMPLLRNQDRSKISKRKNPTSLNWYREQGFLPEALLNFLGLMGYSMPDGREVFSLAEMIESFSWERVKTGGPVFDLEKLDWLNGEYIRAMPASDFAERMAREGLAPAGTPIETLRAMAPMVQERVKRFSEVPDATAYFWRELEYAADDLLPTKKGAPVHDAGETRTVLEQVRSVFEQLPQWKTEAMESAMRAYCDESEWKVRDLFMTLRIAVTGRAVSTPLFETMEVLGRDESLARLSHAIARLT